MKASSDLVCPLCGHYLPDTPEYRAVCDAMCSTGLDATGALSRLARGERVTLRELKRLAVAKERAAKVFHGFTGERHRPCPCVELLAEVA